MGRLRFCGAWTSAVLLIMGLGACGGHKPPGPPSNPAKITLSPAVSTSMQLGSTIGFIATATNSANGTLGATFTYTSSDPNVLDLAPGGIGCAGHWNAPLYTTCTPAGVGMVQVTASALGATSPPTLVFVHPVVDNIKVDQYFTTNPPPALEPCVSKGQTITLQAHAFSQGADITGSVGPFGWTAANSSVVKLTPINNSTSNVPTNQVTALASAPGISQIFANVNGVSSAAFVQTIDTGHGVPLDFFETCPVQNIVLELARAGSGETTFATNKGTAQTVVATVTDVLGNIVTGIPLTWSSSDPATVAAATSCSSETCSVGTTQPGSGTVTASCSPPTCNIGFPLTPPGLAFPELRPYVPVPVYATTAISGVVNGTTTSTSVLVSSFDCFQTNGCTSVLYDVSTTSNQAGVPIPFATIPNSFIIDPLGVKAYAGSDFGALGVTVANLGTANSAFTSLGSITGKALAVSPNGSLAVIADTFHVPNEIYIVNTASSAAATQLPITGATAAAFSLDGIKAYILANNGNSLYIYSTLQALQGPIALTSAAKQFAFSPNGAFAYVDGATTGSGPQLTALNLCNNQVADTVALSSSASVIKTISAAHLEGQDSTGAPFADGVHILALGATGFDVITATSTAIPPTPPLPANSCPQSVTHTRQRIELGQGALDPLNFFMSPDSTRIYILARDRNLVLVYDFNTSSVSGIPIANDVITGDSVEPVAADMTVDRTLLYLGGTDNNLHQINITTGLDLIQLSFPNLPTWHDAFCTVDPIPPGGSTPVPCVLNFVAVKP